VSNPPIREEGGNPGHRVRPSPDEVEAIIAMHRDLPEEERYTHFLIELAANDFEIDAALSMLAGELLESTQLECGEWGSRSVKRRG
jgi:hypothetical protein